MGYVQKNIDYDIVIKSFFDSVVEKVSEYSLYSCTSEKRKKVSVALAQLSLMAKNPEKFFKENKTSYNNDKLSVLFYMKDEKGRHDMMFYVIITRVLGAVYEYFRIPTSKPFKDALDTELKEYFMRYDPSVWHRMLYTVMSPDKMVAYLYKQQKTK